MVNVGKYTIPQTIHVWYIYQHLGSLRGQHGSTKANAPYNECLGMQGQGKQLLPMKKTFAGPRRLQETYWSFSNYPFSFSRQNLLGPQNKITSANFL